MNDIVKVVDSTQDGLDRLFENCFTQPKLKNGKITSRALILVKGRHQKRKVMRRISKFNVFSVINSTNLKCIALDYDCDLFILDITNPADCKRFLALEVTSALVLDGEPYQCPVSQCLCRLSRFPSCRDLREVGVDMPNSNLFVRFPTGKGRVYKTVFGE